MNRKGKPLNKRCFYQNNKMFCGIKSDIVLDMSQFCYFWCFSQGSVVTHCRCGGKCYASLMAKLMMSPTVKRFWKSVNFWFVKVWTNEYQVAHFLWPTVYYVCQLLLSVVAAQLATEFLPTEDIDWTALRHVWGRCYGKLLWLVCAMPADCYIHRLV